MGQWFKSLAINLSTATELLGFVWRRTWWLTPVIVVLILLTGIVVFLEGSALAPYIYVLL